MEEVLIYTDGSSSGVSGAPGGYGAVLIHELDGDSFGPVVREISGGEMSTTNNRQEMLAAIVALEAIRRSKPDRYRIVVHSDSSYLINCMRRGWIAGWRVRNWRTSAKKEVANRDLWERLEAAVARHPEVVWKKVRGHSKADNDHARFNNRADELAVAAKRQIERQTKKEEG